MNGIRSSSRRRFLLAGVLSVAGLGIAGKLSFDRYPKARLEWIEEVIRRNLAGVKLDAASLSHFAQEIAAEDSFQSKKTGVSIIAHRTIPALVAHVGKLSNKVEELERVVLTEFLTGSDFFRVADPTREIIKYYGQLPACGNPFAVFTNA